MSETYKAEETHREMMQGDLFKLARRLTERPELRKKLKPVRSAKTLKPGVYYNAGTTMVERIYAPQKVALGHRMFRISKNPGAPADELQKKVLGRSEVE